MLRLPSVIFAAWAGPATSQWSQSPGATTSLLDLTGTHGLKSDSERFHSVELDRTYRSGQDRCSDQGANLTLSADALESVQPHIISSAAAPGPR